MARLNIESKLFSDTRFLRLVAKLGDHEKAIGSLVLALMTAQQHWFPDRNPIPKDQFISKDLSRGLIEVGLAEELENGDVYMKGSAEHFEWLFEKQRAGSIGGKVSSERRRMRQKTVQAEPSSATAVLQQNQAVLEKTGKNPSNVKQKQPSFSSSFSISVSNSKKKTICYGTIQKLKGNERIEKALESVKNETQELWMQSYPDAEWIKTEVLKAVAWISVNTHKSPKRFDRFMTHWLSKGWETYRKTLPSNNAKTEPINSKYTREELAKEFEEQDRLRKEMGLSVYEP